MSMALFVFAAALFLAYSNGANDNMKGVATLVGTRTLGYKPALALATVATMAGSVVALWLGQELLHAFGGKGLVPDALASGPAFLGAVGLAAATTVILATRLGFPISTTHALTGGLIGAGLMAVGLDVNFGRLLNKFFIPLLISPVLAVGGAVLLYPLFRFLRGKMGVNEETGVFIAAKKRFYALPPQAQLPDAAKTGTFAISESLAAAVPTLEIGERAALVSRYDGAVMGIDAQRLLDGLHVLSAASVSFARGLNDTPKIAALLLAANLVGARVGLGAVGLAIAIGGLISARRVAQTMSEKITRMNAGQGFTANLVTAALVIGASRFGVPVSTTHVSCGALFGIGTVNREAKWRTIAHILLAWVITLPVAAALAAVIFVIVR